jgi:hypothetical protein
MHEHNITPNKLNTNEGYKDTNLNTIATPEDLSFNNGIRLEDIISKIERLIRQSSIIKAQLLLNVYHPFQSQLKIKL